MTTTYDRLGRIVTITRTYDPLGRPAGFELATPYEIEHGYDSYGRFASITSTVNSVTHTTEYTHIPDSRLISGYTLGWITRTVTHEPHRDLVASVINTWNTTNTLSRFDYTNDVIGRRTDRRARICEPSGGNVE